MSPIEPSAKDKALGRRIRTVRKRFGLTQEEFAKELDVTRGAVGNWELGNKITLTNLRGIADRFSVEINWLARDATDQSGLPGQHIDSSQILSDAVAGDKARDVKLVGYVGANSQEHRYAVGEEELDRVYRPAGSSRTTVALEIRGISLGKPFDRWLVYYDERHSPVTPNMLGQLCVVGLPDGRVLIKELRQAKNGRYDLVSLNDEAIKNVTVEWAALVTDIARRR